MKRKNTIAVEDADEIVAQATDNIEPASAAGAEDDIEPDEGHVVDLVTGDPVKLTPKEQVRQEEERKLLEEFGYPEAQKTDLIRVDFRVKPLQGKARRLPLVVLRPVVGGGSPKPEDRIYVLIDIQPEKTRLDDPKNGSEALAELLRDTANAEFAVWTNGIERIVWWKESGRIKIRTKLISDIPRFGKGAEDCFTLDKQALRAAGGLTLRQAFQRCHDHIYANRGGSNETVFWELLKVVFAKIQDERRLQQATAAGTSAERLFRIANLEERNDEKKAEAVKQRLEQLYSEVRNTYPELFGNQTDEIDLPAPILSYVVAQLELYSFLDSSVDVKGEAYEANLGYLSRALTRNVDKEIVRPGWTLVSCGGTLGRTLFVHRNLEGWTASQHVMRLVPNEAEIWPGYLYAFMASRYGQVQVIQRSYGSLIPEIRDFQFQSIAIAIPDDRGKQIHDTIIEAFDCRADALELEDEAIRHFETAIEQGKQHTEEKWGTEY